MFMTLLLLVVPLTALGLVLGMGRLEESLLQARPATVPVEPAAPAAATPTGALR